MGVWDPDCIGRLSDCCPQGSKGHGYYFIRAEPGAEGKWEGVRCELQLDATTELEEEQFKDKRWLFCRSLINLLELYKMNVLFNWKIY